MCSTTENDELQVVLHKWPVSNRQRERILEKMRVFLNGQ